MVSGLVVFQNNFVFSNMSVFDTEMFIVHVEKRENLWKSTCKEYSDKHAKSRAWNDIGSSMFDEWDNFNGDKKTI